MVDGQSGWTAMESEDEFLLVQTMEAACLDCSHDGDIVTAAGSLACKSAYKCRTSGARSRCRCRTAAAGLRIPGVPGYSKAEADITRGLLLEVNSRVFEEAYFVGLLLRARVVAYLAPFYGRILYT